MTRNFVIFIWSACTGLRARKDRSLWKDRMKSSLERVRLSALSLDTPSFHSKSRRRQAADCLSHDTHYPVTQLNGLMFADRWLQ